MIYPQLQSHQVCSSLDLWDKWFFCSDKGFTVFCLSVNSSFHFKGITGTSLLLLFISLQIWVAISFDSHSLPLLFRCMPCQVKYFLCKSVSAIATWLNTFAILFNFLLTAWISRLVTEFLSISYLWGMFTTIMLLLLLRK